MPPPSLRPGLIIIHSNLSESLRDVLVGWMRNHPLHPLEQEVVLVQSSGIAQWLKLALAADAGAGGAGIAAGLDFLLPSRFLWRAYRAVLGTLAVPEISPFDKPRLMWRLLRLLPQVMAEPVYAPLRRFLRDDDDCRKRYQLAERLADLFDQYQVYRADWLAAWARGEDALPRDGGPSRPLPEGQRWQAALWRAILDDVKQQATPDQQAPSSDGRAAVHEAFLRRAAQMDPQTRLPGLPRRIVVFGISTLPRQSVEVLAMLSRWTQVVMCVNNPCAHYWSDIIEGKELLRAENARQSRRQGSPAQIADDALHLHAHPLLAAWGKQGRDFIGLLDEHDSQEARDRIVQLYGDRQERFDLFTPSGGNTLLGQLQEDILDLRPLHETRETWPPVDPDIDTSVRFHVAHSRQREVEILHDQLLAAFDEDATLRARDVIVMVPDIEAYAPHIQAVFGLHEASDRRSIACTIADRGKRHVEPMLHALAQLLQLPRARFAVSELMDLLEVPALRNRFQIGEDQLPLLHAWIRGANIRWGLHDEQRQSLGLPPSGVQAAQNTWLFGLRRIALGYAVGAKGECWNGIEPYDDIGGLDAVLLGPLMQLIEALEETWRVLAQPAGPAQWGLRFEEMLDRFFLAQDNADAFTRQQLSGALQEWLQICAEAEVTEALPLSVVGEHWLAQLDEGGLSQRFFGGAVTCATLMPMRAIPFRMVCLLGMNDGDYPRVRIPMDFDLMGRDYRPGDRSRREDDRYLFLEALLSARDRLYISWVGKSVRDNTPRPPSVLVGQLRDHIAAGWVLESGEDRDEDTEPGKGSGAAGRANGQALVDALTTEHRLQPFSNAYFSQDPWHAGGETARLFTYAGEWQGKAENRAQADAGLAPPQREEPLTLRELAEFLKAPVDAFYRQRLHINFSTDDPTAEDIEPFVPDQLEKWKLQDALIKSQSRALQAGHDAHARRAAVLERFGREGVLAAGAFGALIASDLAAPLDDMLQRYTQALERWPQEQEGELPIASGTVAAGVAVQLEDWLGGFRADMQGERCRLVLESSDLIVKGKFRADRLVAHWVAHIAAQFTGGGVTTTIVGKSQNVDFRPVDAADALACMEGWLRAWQEGMTRPLPLEVTSAFEWLTRQPSPLPDAYDDSAARDIARNVYDGNRLAPGRVGRSAYLAAVYPDFAALTRSGEFYDLARQLLGPMRVALHAGKKKGGAKAAKGEGDE